MLREALLEFKPSQWDEALHECVKAQVETEWALAKDSTTTTTTTPSYGWSVFSGPCTMDPVDMCIKSPNFPGPYPDWYGCKIAVEQPYLQEVTAIQFNTERGWDFLKINGVKYHGGQSYAPDSVTPTTSATGDSIEWLSDSCCKPGGSVQGFRLCADKGPPMSPLPVHFTLAQFKGGSFTTKISKAGVPYNEWNFDEPDDVVIPKTGPCSSIATVSWEEKKEDCQACTGAACDSNCDQVSACALDEDCDSRSCRDEASTPSCQQGRCMRTDGDGLVFRCGRRSYRESLVKSFVRDLATLCAEDVNGLSTRCPGVCAQCNMATKPSEAAAIRACQLTSIDDAVYTDWLGERCSWYLANDHDPGAECNTYGTPETKQKCRLTCDTCFRDHFAPTTMFDRYDQNDDGFLDAQEINTLFSNVGLPPITSNTWPSDEENHIIESSVCPKKAVSDGCDADCPEKTQACASQNKGKIAKDVLMNPLLNFERDVVSQGWNLVKEADESSTPLNFMGLQSKTKVDRFPSPMNLAGSSNLMLRIEDSVPSFPECIENEDCKDMTTYACGNIANSRNKLCRRTYAVPMYCARSSLTPKRGSESR